MITKHMQRNTIDYGRLSANMIAYCGPTYFFTDNRCLAEEQVLLSIGLFTATFQLQWYYHFELYHGVAIHIHIRVASEYIRLASLKAGADSPWIVAFNSDFYKNTLMRFLTSGQHPNGHRDLARLNCTSLKQESTFLHRQHLHAKHYTRKQGEQPILRGMNEKFNPNKMARILHTIFSYAFHWKIKSLFCFKFQ